jgi:MoaA/NifB/PqqE/SkfB family radical SAM enzyme
MQSDGFNLTYQPCCWYKGRLDVFDPTFDEDKNRISQITDWVPECGACKQIEDSGVYGNRSPRLRSFEEIPDGSIPDNVPGWMELTIDITCNAACVMCGPLHSTTWIKQEIKFGIKTKHDLPDMVDPFVWLDKIKSIFTLKYVKSVSFLGGEPFESPIPLEFLKLLKQEHGSLAEVEVHFQTNGSLKPELELIDLMRECKRIKFNMSLDGVGPRLEYIRYPLQWYRIENTLAYMKSLNLPNIKFFILATLTPLNAYYYNELEAWAAEHIGELGKPIWPNRAIGKADLNQTPQLLRQVIIDKFGIDHPVGKMFSNLDHTMQSCIPYFDNLDRNRKTNWRETFPEIVKYLEDDLRIKMQNYVQ